MPITFSPKDITFDVSTRVTPVTNIESQFNVAYFLNGELYNSDNCIVYPETEEGEWVMYSNATDEAVYWPLTGTCDFYASNSAKFCYIGAPDYNNPPYVCICDVPDYPFPSTDVVCASRLNATKGSTVSLSFSHVLARIGTLIINTQEGYEISGKSASLIYEIPAYNDWDDPDLIDKIVYNYDDISPDFGIYGWNGEDEFNVIQFDESIEGSTEIRSLIVGANDIFIVPGTYTIEVKYTLTKGDYVKSFTKRGTVTLQQGKINNITCTAVGGNAQEIDFSVSVQSWGTTTLTPTLS